MNDSEWLDRKHNEMVRQLKEQLREAKERAAREGKEPFDFAKLLELYDPSSDLSSTGLVDPKRTAEELEARYYVDYPKVMTVAEFARCMEEYRSWR